MPGQRHSRSSRRAALRLAPCSGAWIRPKQRSRAAAPAMFHRPAPSPLQARTRSSSLICQLRSMHSTRGLAQPLPAGLKQLPHPIAPPHHHLRRQQRRKSPPSSQTSRQTQDRLPWPNRPVPSFCQRPCQSPPRNHRFPPRPFRVGAPLPPTAPIRPKIALPTRAAPAIAQASPTAQAVVALAPSAVPALPQPNAAPLQTRSGVPAASPRISEPSPPSTTELLQVPKGVARPAIREVFTSPTLATSAAALIPASTPGRAPAVPLSASATNPANVGSDTAPPPRRSIRWTASIARRTADHGSVAIGGENLATGFLRHAPPHRHNAPYPRAFSAHTIQRKDVQSRRRFHSQLRRSRRSCRHAHLRSEMPHRQKTLLNPKPTRQANRLMWRQLLAPQRPRLTPKRSRPPSCLQAR